MGITVVGGSQGFDDGGGDGGSEGMSTKRAFQEAPDDTTTS